MAAWRRRALAELPELRQEAEDPETSLYAFLHVLVNVLHGAVEGGDDGLARRVERYAEGCWEGGDVSLRNAVAVSFYEHLFDAPRAHWVDLLSRIPPPIREQVWPLWESMLGAEDHARLREALPEAERRRQRRHRRRR